MKLTNKHYRTYDLLKKNTILGIITTQRDIYENYPVETYPNDGFVWNENPKSHDHCANIWSVINDLNSCDTIHKVIISPKPYEYKIAETEEEVREYAKKLYYDNAMAKLWRYGNMLKKVKRNGQGKLVFDTESQARDFWETFLHEQLETLVELDNENRAETNHNS